VNVLPLAVLDQLPFKGLFITELDDPHRDLLNLGELRGTKAAGSRNDFEAVGVRSGNYGLYKTLRADALRQLIELSFIKGASWVGTRFMKTLKREILKIRHNCGAHGVFVLFGL
jgi:hypothetical protein